MNLAMLQKIFEEKIPLDKLRPVVIGISGGPDSLCLLDLMRKMGIPLLVGHLNHGLRDAADTEEKKVKFLCEEWNLPYFTKLVKIKEVIKTSGHTVEEAGRIARYLFLFDLASNKNAQAVMVAHNSDDQVETILMHLLRGSGLPGLRGMDYRQLPNEWSDTIPLVRPLLGVSKQEILEYCQNNGLSPSFDSSNQDKTFYRNRLRLELVPFLETYNPNIKVRVTRMAEVIREEDDFLQWTTENAVHKCVTRSGEGFYILDKRLTNELSPAIKRRLVLYLMRKLKPETPSITFDVIESAKVFMDNATMKGKRSLAAGLEICGYLKNFLLLADRKNPLNGLWPQISTSKISIDGSEETIPLNDRWKLEFPADIEISRVDPWRACLDADKCKGLHFDTFSPGDRFIPLGMNGKSIKLGDFWTNEGLPARARTYWPLLKSNDDILWIPGFTINENYKVTGQTKKKIALRVSQTE
jgi:tRNA(Ile)-lysidine synthase